VEDSHAASDIFFNFVEVRARACYFNGDKFLDSVRFIVLICPVASVTPVCRAEI